jgi:hypothetical protein
VTAFVDVDRDADRIADLSFLVAPRLKMQRVPAKRAIVAQKAHVDIAEQRAVAHLPQCVEHRRDVVGVDKSIPMPPDQFRKGDAEIAARPRIGVLNHSVSRRAPYERWQKVSRIVHGRRASLFRRGASPDAASNDATVSEYHTTKAIDNAAKCHCRFHTSERRM